jgi:catechol 2,3-dioxygenase-like lactoylglutathione lyase family enzyme
VTPLADHIAYVALVSADPEAAGAVFERHFRLPRHELSSPGGPVPLYPLGRGALALFPATHPLVGGEMKSGVHHIALAAENVEAAGARAAAVGIATDGGPADGLGGRRMRRLARDAAGGVRIVLTEPLALSPPAGGPVERLDHVGVASTDVVEDEALFAGRLGFAVESRQTDMEVSIAVESFTSDKYGAVYHSRAPEPVGGLRVTFITVGDCELEFLADFVPGPPSPARAAGGRARDGRGTVEPGTTRQDQGAISRFVAGRGRGLHHFALKVRDIDALLAEMAAAGVPMIDTRGRPGSRRARIGFPHPRALGGVLMHMVEREA